MALFAATHESGCGTFRTSPDVRIESVMRIKADVGRTCQKPWKVVQFFAVLPRVRVPAAKMGCGGKDLVGCTLIAAPRPAAQVIWIQIYLTHSNRSGILRNRSAILSAPPPTLRKRRCHHGRLPPQNRRQLRRELQLSTARDLVQQ
jgi:hypothetical protein